MADGATRSPPRSAASIPSGVTADALCEVDGENSDVAVPLMRITAWLEPMLSGHCQLKMPRLAPAPRHAVIANAQGVRTVLLATQEVHDVLGFLHVLNELVKLRHCELHRNRFDL